MILIAYDGSDDAKSAIEHAGSLLSGQPATVVTVWEPYTQTLARYPVLAPVAVDDAGEIDNASSSAADEKAEEGAALARAHGLDAASYGLTHERSTAETLLAEADRINASAIVVGSRGLGGLSSLLSGQRVACAGCNTPTGPSSSFPRPRWPASATTGAVPLTGRRSDGGSR